MKQKNSKKKLEPIKFKFDTKLLDRFASMYSKCSKAVGELVVNGYDADATWAKVDIKAGKITIGDNGNGMDEKDIRDEYMMLGSEHKRKIKRTPKFKRLPIGNKGIGKLAGIGIANRMSVITIKGGKRYEYQIDREEIGKYKTLEDAFRDLTVEDCGGEPSGTIVELTKILPYIKIDIDELRGHFAHDIPQSSNFQIFVNSKRCLRKDIPAKRRIPVNISDDVCGEIKGEIIVSKKALTSVSPGISTTCRGRVIGPPSLFGLTRSAHRFYYTLSALIIGMVEVASFDPENGQGVLSVIKTDREGFYEDHPKYKRYYKLMTELLTQICREEEKEFEKRKEAEIKAKVREALKNVTDDFNAYNKKKKQEVKNQMAERAEENVSGDSKFFKETEKPLVHSREPNKKERTNPVGITDKHLREELKGLIGHGTIHLGDKRYKVTLKPLGIDDWECRIEDQALVININTSHPAYGQAVAEKAVEITVFRAIAAARAWKESETPENLYEQLDSMIRFQAERMVKRRLGIKRTRKA